jgi:putative transposase
MTSSVAVFSYLKEENEILRAKLPPKITVKRPERERLLKFAEPLGAAPRKLISIVHPDTFLLWQRERKRSGRKLKIHRRGLSITSECLDHFIVFGEKHLNYLVRE